MSPLQAAVWFFCRLRRADDHLLATGELKQGRAWCNIANCSHPQILRDGSNTTNLKSHLLVRHNLTEACFLNVFCVSCLCISRGQ